MAILWERAVTEFGIPIVANVYYLEEKAIVLKSNMQDLSNQKHDLEMKLSAAERIGQQRTTGVQAWLEDVREMRDEVANIINAVSHIVWYARINLGNRVEKALKQVAALQDKCKKFETLVMPGIMPMSVTKMVGETIGRTKEEIWEYLMDPEVGTIGIYGMAGVGKTFIMKHIFNQLIESRRFGVHVFWVKMSEAMSLQMVQGEIANVIGLELSNDEDEMNRSRRILMALNSMKKFVLILDDVWEVFRLDEIGIPELKDGQKLVLTTRDFGVCAILQSGKLIKVGVPSEDAACELLKNKIGGDMVLSPNVQDIARKVVNECGRLPLAIVTVGKDLWQKSDEAVWRNTLNKLRFMKKIKYMEEHILPRLRSSYDHLRKKEYQDHFLYCALYPQQHHILSREIIEHWVWDGLIEEEVGNKQVEIDEGDTILKELKDACLLESCESNVECVKMHNLIRHMAIGITRTTKQFMVKAGVELEELPSDEEWTEDLVRISFMKSNIQVLPHELKCLKLSTLLLQNNNSLRRIMSPSFFFSLHCLRVLNLSHTAIESLPESISALVNLHALLLGSCSRLNGLPPLRNQKKLRVLDISSTAIVELPEGLEELVKLRRLDLSRTCELRVIETGLMSNLFSLEDLEMNGNGWTWPSNSEQMSRVIEEVTNLRRFRNLGLHFPDLVSLIDYVNSQNWRRLKTFALVVGRASELCPRLLGYSVALASCDLIDQENSPVIPDNTELLQIEECRLEISKCRGMENLRFLYVKACHHLNILFSLGLLQKLTKLEEVKVQDCRLMKEMVAKEERDVEATRNTRRRMTITFPRSLKLLTLVDLPELESIGGESVSCISLTCLVIKNCPKLKKIPFDDLSSNLKGEIKGSRVWWDALEWDNITSRTILQGLFIEDRA